MTKSKLLIYFILIIIYIPLLFLIVFSFNDANTMSSFEGFTLAHYVDLTADTTILRVLINSLIVGIIASMIATIVGTIGAITIYQTKNKRKEIQLKQLNNIMILAPDVVIGVAFLSLFTIVGFKLGLFSVIITHAVFCVPIVVISVLP